jgi:nucleolar protein 56
LGAEKALFRALKTKGKTPKYGLIFNSTFIGRAGQKNKGRISRYLANKCAIAARIDSFAEGTPTSKFGDTLKEQIEERLNFLANGTKPRKNKDAMKEVLDELKSEGLYYNGTHNAKAEVVENGKVKDAEKNGKKDKKKKVVVESSSESESESSEDEKKKKKKKREEKEKSKLKDKKKKKVVESSSDDSSSEEESEDIKPQKKKLKTK